MQLKSPTLNEMEYLARSAGEILRQGFVRRPGIENRLQVDYKGEIDLVTEIDYRSEAFLLGEIRRRYPDHYIVSEESGETRGDGCCRWYVDPLDGTVNFAHGVPIFTVSIAYSQGDLLQLGVVYDPIQDECFCARRGEGAWLNSHPIRVSGAVDLNQSLLVTGFPYDIRTNPQNNLDNYARFALRTQGVRRLGSAALDLCYVAAGRFDGFWELRLSPWDIAAGGLVAREAGAIITNLQGGEEFLAPPHSLVAATPGIHAAMLALLSNNPS